ncbi:MAG: GDSL-type esterase/lipase family protein [Cyanobacteria bacterium P01_H01_bin.119]
MSDLSILAGQLLAESITASSGKAPPVVHWDKAVPSELRNAQGLQLEEDSQQSADEHAAIAATIQPTINSQPRFSPLMTPQPIAPARPNQDGAAQPTQLERDRTLISAIQQRLAAVAAPDLPSVEPFQSRLQPTVLPVMPAHTGPRPQSGSQLYQQRLAALRSGQQYTRLSPDSFYDHWQTAAQSPTYSQWRTLLTQEAQAMASGQGQNRLTVVLGDSISLWLPPESLPRDRFWLNQGISGDTTTGILQRLDAIAATRPDTIHLMAGINDLKNGASDATVLNNLQTIVQRLRQQHPQAQIIVHSILPTRLSNLPSDRIARLNQRLAAMSQAEGGQFLNLQTRFADPGGNLRPELTTDGLHLNPSGYRLWQIALLSV